MKRKETLSIQTSNRCPNLIQELKRLKGRISFNVPMNRYTTMRTGVEAFALYQPDSLDSLKEALNLCNRMNISFLAIGAGSNIIVANKGPKRVMIKLSSPFFKKIEVYNNIITCGAGVRLNELTHIAESHLLSGVEFLVGIPGTVGGAVIQNAGAFGNSIADIIESVAVLDKKGNTKVLSREEIDFGYRRCNLDRFIILETVIRLKREDSARIRKDISRYIEKRLSTQDYTAPSAGCIFKNPQDCKMSAGELIDKCGLRGANIGGAFVSEKHANFIINKRNASVDDILHLMRLVRRNVRDRFGITLEEEIKII